MSDADPRPIEPYPETVERPRRRWLSTIVVLLAIGFGVVVAWYLANNAKAPGGGPPGASGAPGPGGASGGRRGRGGRGGFGGGGAVTVGTATAVAADVPITLDALGTVTPPVTATIRTQIAGRLFSVNFREGQSVKKGQLLAQVDPRPYQQLLDQAKGTLARDLAQLAAAKVDLERYQTLLKQDSIARQTVDTQAALVRQYSGTVTTDKGAVGAAQLNLDYTSVKAPVTGKVGLRGVDVGNYVTPGDAAALVVITQVAPIDVLFTLPQDRVPAVQARLRAGAGLPVTALDRDGGTAIAQGEFSTLDNQIDVSTGTVKAKARFANTDGALFPNQFVNTRLLLDTIKGAVTVPATAIRNGPKGNFVFVVGPGSKAKLTLVTLGQSVGDTVSIASGLAVGAVVVTEGADKLKDGGMVTLPGARGRGGRGPGGPGAGPGAGGGADPAADQGAGAGAGPAGGYPAGGGAGGGSGGHRHHRAQSDG